MKMLELVRHNRIQTLKPCIYKVEQYMTTNITSQHLNICRFVHASRQSVSSDVPRSAFRFTNRYLSNAVHIPKVHHFHTFSLSSINRLSCTLSFINRRHVFMNMDVQCFSGASVHHNANLTEKPQGNDVSRLIKQLPSNDIYGNAESDSVCGWYVEKLVDVADKMLVHSHCKDAMAVVDKLKLLLRHGFCLGQIVHYMEDLQFSTDHIEAQIRSMKLLNPSHMCMYALHMMLQGFGYTQLPADRKPLHVLWMEECGLSEEQYLHMFLKSATLKPRSKHQTYMHTKFVVIPRMKLLLDFGISLDVILENLSLLNTTYLSEKLDMLRDEPAEQWCLQYPKLVLNMPPQCLLYFIKEAATIDMQYVNVHAAEFVCGYFTRKSRVHTKAKTFFKYLNGGKSSYDWFKVECEFQQFVNTLSADTDLSDEQRLAKMHVMARYGRKMTRYETSLFVNSCIIMHHGFNVADIREVPFVLLNDSDSIERNIHRVQHVKKIDRFVSNHSHNIYRLILLQHYINVKG